MIGDNAYCTSQGESYGCLNNNDCLSGYECKSYSCKPVPKNQTDENNNDKESNGNGICLILPLILMGGLFAWKRLN